MLLVFTGVGYAGAGIYFAETPSDARRKSQHGNDVCLKALVWLGKSKVIDRRDPNITFTSLKREGFDSVRLTAFTGDEYIVYNWDQVEDIQRFDEMRV